MKFNRFLLFLLFLLPACTLPGRSQLRPWWREAVFYEIFVRSFYDSNGDGIGDFNGLTEKLDYLNDGDAATTDDLGVTAIWLMPIHPSPSYHGYDVTNFYAVNPQYGSLQDFKRLLSEAHARGIHILIDLVLNHSSSQHPFFQDALHGPDSRYYDWYIWSTSGGTNWHAAGDSRYYYGLFCDCMPDLNYRNPQVTTQMQNVVRFWLQDVGVDGFRVDAARHLIEAGRQTENTSATHDWYKSSFFPYYKRIEPQAYTVGEVFGAGSSMVQTYTGDQLDQVFNFEMASGFVNSAAGGSNTAVTSAVKFALHDMPDFDFATFLTNHDQNRAMSVFNGDADKAKVAASLMLTAPGTPFIYYGEEIGMQGKKPDEDIRLPMQWSQAHAAGFTTDTPWRAVGAGFEQNNVADESADPNSLLSHYRELIRLRAAHPALRSSIIWLVDTGTPSIYAALRAQDDDMILVLVNLGDEDSTDYRLKLSASALPSGTYSLQALMGVVPVPGLSVNPQGGITVQGSLALLAPHSTHILQIIAR